MCSATCVARENREDLQNGEDVCFAESHAITSQYSHAIELFTLSARLMFQELCEPTKKLAEETASTRQVAERDTDDGGGSDGCVLCALPHVG